MKCQLQILILINATSVFREEMGVELRPYATMFVSAILFDFDGGILTE
jgi:hypothetical protein